MKYIKRIDEFFGGEYDHELIKELQHISDMYLSYLIDDGFDIESRIEDGYYSILIRKKIENRGSIFSINNKEKFFKYSEVKDNIIQFVEYLNKEYDIDNVFFLGDWAEKGWLDKITDKISGTKSRSRMRLKADPNKIISDSISVGFDPISISVNIIGKKNNKLK